MAARIGREFAGHGETATACVANTEKWGSADAVRAYRAAVSKEVDRVVVTRSVGDVPLFANTPLGKGAAPVPHLQLRQSSARALARDAGRPRAYASGGQRYERFKAAVENPGYLIGEALDASGFFALPIEAAATVDTMTGVNPLKDPLMAAFPDAPQSGQGVRRIGVDPV